MALPYFHSKDPQMNLLQTNWKSQLTPAINNPLNNGVFLNNVVLTAGTNVINTTLQRTQQGWIITDIQAASTIFRNAPFNTITLSLHSSAATTVNILVF
jgi:hypothetical protein